jgi:formate hydrogenlyase subunit 3/multisubunit Na+/H+ antiporter MnhD subunit
LSHVFAVVFLAAGVLLMAIGSPLIATGRNFRGLLGRGFSADDNRRLERAPASYFRAMGSMALSLGLLLLFLGAGSWIPAQAGGPVSGLLQVFAVLLFVGVLGSVIWFLVLSARYRLFRWNKP